MKRNGFSNGKFGVKLSLISAAVLLLLLAVVAIQFKDKNPDMESTVQALTQKREIVSRMRINILRSADIEKGAVMADSDELSRALAEQSTQAADDVDHDRARLARLLDRDRTESELKLINEFDGCWTDLRKIDKVLLQFAVENTNIKAFALSFTRGKLDMEDFKKDLTEVIRCGSTNDCGVQMIQLAWEALAAGSQVQSLHAMHISARSDEEMDKIEAEIRHSNEVVSDSLKEMEKLLPGDSKDSREGLRKAALAYADFEAVTFEVIQLSRQNTNIKSFELSLGRKRKVTAQCDEILGNLQEILRNRNFEATR